MINNTVVIKIKKSIIKTNKIPLVKKRNQKSYYTI